MTEWPPAEALRRALEEQHVKPNLDRMWTRIEEANQTPLRVIAEPIVEPELPGRPKRWFGAMVAAAAVLLVFLVSTQLLDEPDPGAVGVVGEEPSVDDSDGPTPTIAPRPESTVAPSIPPPTLDLPDLGMLNGGPAKCSDPLPLGAYRLEDAPTVSVYVAQTPTPSAQSAWVHIVDGPADRFVEQVLPTIDEDLEGLVLVVPSEPAEALPATFSGVGRHFCPPVTPRLLLSGGSSADAACQTPYPGAGWHNYALVGSDAAPPDCLLPQPTFIVDNRPASDPGVTAWAEAHQCGLATSRTDGSNNIITEWDNCDTTLRHVQTSTEDPWAAVIEGEPTVTYLNRLDQIAQ